MEDPLTDTNFAVLRSFGPVVGADPTGAWPRETAAMLGQDIWITVKLPGEHGGDDGTAIRRWATVVLHLDELGRLREALVLDAQDARLDAEDE
jgi:hypothetical protein